MFSGTPSLKFCLKGTKHLGADPNEVSWGRDLPNFNIILHSSQCLVHFLTYSMYSDICGINELIAHIFEEKIYTLQYGIL